MRRHTRWFGRLSAVHTGRDGTGSESTWTVRSSEERGKLLLGGRGQVKMSVIERRQETALSFSNLLSPPPDHGPYLAREARDNGQQREGAFAFGFLHSDIALVKHSIQTLIAFSLLFPL